MAKKIFISPSNQTDNAYAYGNTTEAVQCGRIAAALKTALDRCGFETKLMHYYSMANKVAAANTWGANLYLPVHTYTVLGLRSERLPTLPCKGEPEMQDTPPCQSQRNTGSAAKRFPCFFIPFSEAGCKRIGGPLDCKRKGAGRSPLLKRPVQTRHFVEYFPCQTARFVF